MNDLRVAVVGGSIAGPLVAALLQRRAGIDVKIFEQARPRFGQGGGVIFLDLTTLEVMDDLGVDRASLVDFDGEFDDADPKAPAMRLLAYLGWLEEHLLEALSSP